MKATSGPSSKRQSDLGCSTRRTTPITSTSRAGGKMARPPRARVRAKPREKLAGLQLSRPTIRMPTWITDILGKDPPCLTGTPSTPQVSPMSAATPADYYQLILLPRRVPQAIWRIDGSLKVLGHHLVSWILSPWWDPVVGYDSYMLGAVTSIGDACTPQVFPSLWIGGKSSPTVFMCTVAIVVMASHLLPSCPSTVRFPGRPGSIRSAQYEDQSCCM